METKRLLLLALAIMTLVPSAAEAQVLAEDEDTRWLHVGLRAVMFPAGRVYETDASHSSKTYNAPFDVAPSLTFDATVVGRHLSLGIGTDFAARVQIFSISARLKLHHRVGSFEPYLLAAPGYSHLFTGGRDGMGYSFALAVGVATGTGGIRPFIELGYMWCFLQRELGSSTSPPIYTQDSGVDRAMVVVGLQFSFGDRRLASRHLSPSEREALDRRQELLRRQLAPKRVPPSSREQLPPSSRTNAD